MTHHQVFIGDARQMNEVQDSSVHLIVTSPPYWQLNNIFHTNNARITGTMDFIK
jgi:DNA modification methylase